MTNVQLNIDFASIERDKGIKTAKYHADSVVPDWSEKAYETFKEWLRGWASGHKFLIEDFRLSANARGLPDPPSNRAFGFISVRAKKEGLIIFAGTKRVRNVKAHCANASCWQKV